jgi:DNA-directed RNA polymerase specialized sigma24 family protein
MEYTNSQIKFAIAENIHSERDRQILERRLIDGITFERLAEEFQLSVRQTRTIVHKCESVLFKHLRKD